MDFHVIPHSMKVVKLDGGTDAEAEAAADVGLAAMNDALAAAGAVVDPIAFDDARSRLRIVQSPDE